MSTKGEISTISQLAAIFGSEWLMVIFYGDESGAHGKGDYVISGYVSHRDTWKFFDENWNRVLGEFNPRPIEYLKMSEWQHRDGQFKGWNDDDAVTKLGHLFSVLAAFLSTGSIGEFTSSVSWEIYGRCVNGRCKEVFSDPYYFNLRQVALRAAQFAKLKGYDGEIHYVFDTGNSAEHNAPRHFAYVKQFAETSVRCCMGKITFDDDKKVPGLQAADVIAWNTRRGLSDLNLPDEHIHTFVLDTLQRLPGSYSREQIHEEGLTGFNDLVNKFIDHLETSGGFEHLKT